MMAVARVPEVAMADQPVTNPVRLSDVIGSPWWVWAFCLDCQHDRFVRPEGIELPGSFPVYRIGERMTCSSCRGRRIHTKTSQCWHDLNPSKMASFLLVAQRPSGHSPVACSFTKCIVLPVQLDGGSQKVA